MENMVCTDHGLTAANSSYCSIDPDVSPSVYNSIKYHQFGLQLDNNSEVAEQYS